MTPVEKRIALEKRIVRRMIRHLKQNGYTLHSVDDGGDEDTRVRTEKEAMDAVFGVDEAHLYFQTPEFPKLMGVFLVMGNDGWDVIADHSYPDETKCNFGALMDCITDWAGDLAC
jgi:hypothetical protein